MPTVTEPGLRRRAALQGLLGLVWAGPALAQPVAKASDELLAAWSDAQGQHHIGLLRVQGVALAVVASVPVPTRAHGLLWEPEGSALALARRPGEWLLRWWPGTRRSPQWLWSAPDRRFNGHALRGAEGRWLYTVEAEQAGGTSLIARRDAASLALDAEWPTGGLDAHQLLADGPDALLVANGGVPTLPETGRARRGMERMASSLVRLRLGDGALQGRWALDDPRLSLRHLARHADGTVGIALQAEHDEAAAREAAPLLALFDGRSLRLAPQPQAMAGYGGDVLAEPEGFVVSATRAGGLARWDAQGAWRGWTPLAEACALAPGWAGGRGVALAHDTDGPRALPALQLDNHWQRRG